MKKLLATTALFGASALAVSAQAAPLSVTVGGELDFQAGIADQEAAFQTGAFSRDVKFNNKDTEINVKVEGQADNGLKYGAVIELEADVTADANGEGGNADKTYIFLEGGFGRAELGNNTGAQEALSVGADSIAVAAGGIDGNWDQYVNLTGGSFTFLPDLSTAAAKGGVEDATKITYYTPSFSGFSGGVSYTPDTGDAGTAAGFSGELGTDFENVFGVGVQFDGEVSGVGVQAGINGEFGDSESAALEDLSAWEAGLVVEASGFALGASYGDRGESGAAVGSGVESSYWTAGAAYESGAVGVSATYIDGETDLGAAGSDDATALSVGADYDLAPGLTPYIEATFFELDAAATTVDNEGSVVILGTSLQF